MHRHVETLIGRLVTDPKLRRRFARNPAEVLDALRGYGLELTRVELAALATLDPEALRTLAQTLDPRLRRADHEAEPEARGNAASTMEEES